MALNYAGNNFISGYPGAEYFTTSGNMEKFEPIKGAGFAAVIDLHGSTLAIEFGMCPCRGCFIQWA